MGTRLIRPAEVTAIWPELQTWGVGGTMGWSRRYTRFAGRVWETRGRCRHTADGELCHVQLSVAVLRDFGWLWDQVWLRHMPREEVGPTLDALFAELPAFALEETL